MTDSRDAYVNAHTIRAGNFVVGQDITINGDLSAAVRADTETLLRRIAEQIERHRDSLVLADDLQADVAQIARELQEDDQSDVGRQLRLRARIDRLAAGVSSVATLAGTVRELASAVGL